MENPSGDSLVLPEGLAVSSRQLACGVMQLGSEEGIICTAGNQDDSETG